MVIVKNEKTYIVKENRLSWTVSRSIGRLTISANVPKSDCSTFAELQKFVNENDIF